MPDTFAFDPSLVSDLEDPIPALRELQEHSPVHWSARYGAWLITRYADVRAGLADARLTTRRVFPHPKDVDEEFARMYADYCKFLDLWAVARELPDDTRLRLLGHLRHRGNLHVGDDGGRVSLDNRRPRAKRCAGCRNWAQLRH